MSFYPLPQKTSKPRFFSLCFSLCTQQNSRPASISLEIIILLFSSVSTIILGYFSQREARADLFYQITLLLTLSLYYKGNQKRFWFQCGSSHFMHIKPRPTKPAVVNFFRSFLHLLYFLSIDSLHKSMWHVNKNKFMR